MTVATITYTKQRASLVGKHSRRSYEDQLFVYKLLVFGSLLLATGLFIGHETDWNDSIMIGKVSSASTLLRLLRPYGRSSPLSNNINNNNAPIVLEPYREPTKQYPRTIWTLDEFVVHGVNLAHFGLEEETDNNNQRLVLIDGWFLLNEDFDISPDLQLQRNRRDNENYSTPTASDLLLYHRHLEHASLAFYMDKIAQKRYHQAVGIPVPNSYALQYKDTWKEDNNKDSGASTDAQDKEAIEKLLPKDTDYVVKASHQRKGSAILVRSKEDEFLSPKQSQLLMGTKPDAINEAYDVTQVATTIAEAMHQDVKYSDPWALLHVPPGVVVEERITAFDTPHRPALELQVLVIWGRVWMASWPKAEGPTHPGMIHRNGTVVMDDHVAVPIPSWIPWETIVTMAEDLGQHKDLYQVNVLVGTPADTAHMVQHLPRQEQLKTIQVVVSSVQLDPTISFYEKELLDEMGRLWLAGYEMGIFRTIKNPEVPVEYIRHSKLTEQDAQQPHIVRQWTQTVNWKAHTAINSDGTED